ncbi:UNVERIFIED_CONTAM: hypothetical protein FKN15_033039 [Acipenser sinensis]
MAEVSAAGQIGPNCLACDSESDCAEQEKGGAQTLNNKCKEVLAIEAVLNTPTRADWRECKYTRDEEESLAKEYREREPCDFSLLKQDRLPSNAAPTHYSH